LRALAKMNATVVRCTKSGLTASMIATSASQICLELGYTGPVWGTSMADYYSVIARAVSRLPSKTDEARHEIYERARTALRETLRNSNPPFSEAELATEQAALEVAISMVEVVSDLRHGAETV
jgi:hypothetical protein